MKRGLVLWFTGLSGSGKTTIARAVGRILSERKKKIKILDGDVVRKKVTSHLGFSPKDIEENNRIISKLCLKEKLEYDYILVPIISPFKKSRDLARRMMDGSFYLVYCRAPLDVVVKRDPKGLYKKALAGEISSFIGIDRSVPYQAPRDADIVLDTAAQSAKVCAARLIDFIDSKEARRPSRP